MIHLDTLDEGRSAGLYCDKRREWLSQRLQEAKLHDVVDAGEEQADQGKFDGGRHVARQGRCVQAISVALIQSR